MHGTQVYRCAQPQRRPLLPKVPHLMEGHQWTKTASMARAAMQETQIGWRTAESSTAQPMGQRDLAARRRGVAAADASRVDENEESPPCSN
jgi:hypothetical protein